MRYAAKNPFSYVHANIGGQVALFETIKVRPCTLSSAAFVSQLLTRPFPQAA